MRIFKIIVLVSPFFILGCEKSEKIEDYIYKTWDLDWKQCGVYQNRYDAKVNFTQTDSADYGWFVEQGRDTVKFDVEIVSDRQINLLMVTDSIWEGSLTINEFSSGTLVFEKENKECANEVYHFE